VNPRLFSRVASLEARTRMSYRVDFWFQVVVEFGAQFAIVYFLWQAMYLESGREVIGGRTFGQTVLYYLVVILLGKLVRGLAFEGAVSSDIYEGGLNRYLVFPAAYLPFKYAQHIGRMLPSVLQFLFFSVGLIWLLDLPDTPEFTIAGAAMSLTAVALGNLLLFLINFPIESIAFWADNVWSLRVGIRLISSLLGGLALPLSIFPTQVQPLLEALPFRYLFDFPARLLLGEIGFEAWVAGMVTCFAWCVFFGALSWVVWQRGRRVYTGIGI
jgi:ABC-2 type transport system permease protein